MANILGIDTDALIAKLQGYAADFLGSKSKLYAERSKIESLLQQAKAAGYVTVGNKQFTLSQLSELYSENTRLISDQADLERKFLSAIEEYNTIKQAAEASAEVTVGIPGIAGVSGLDAVPVALIAWGTGAAVLVTSILYFMSRVKAHLNNLAGVTAGSILGIGTILAIAGGAYLLLRR